MSTYSLSITRKINALSKKKTVPMKKYLKYILFFVKTHSIIVFLYCNLGNLVRCVGRFDCEIFYQQFHFKILFAAACRLRITIHLRSKRYKLRTKFMVNIPSHILVVFQDAVRSVVYFLTCLRFLQH